jgi:hypothetical protein
MKVDQEWVADVEGRENATCRIALLSFPDRTNFVPRPMNALAWSMVLKDILAAINLCVRREHHAAIDFIKRPVSRHLVFLVA